jgi:hypothetical protein
MFPNRRRRPKPGEDVLSPDDRMLIGNSVRINVPLDHSRNLRRYAEFLRGFAMQIDFLSRRTDLSERQILDTVRTHATMTNEKMREINTRKRPAPHPDWLD